MTDHSKKASDKDHEIEREILEHREFSLAEAIGRMGGSDLLKGVSPVTQKRQAELVIDSVLEKYLRDAEGALEVVLLRELSNSQILLETDYEQPIFALKVYCRRLLDSPARLDDFVRRVDVQWGRIYFERPRFNKPGKPAADDDPYTPESVRRQLEGLLSSLPGDAPG